MTTSLDTPEEVRQAQAKALSQSSNWLDRATADGLTMSAQRFLREVSIRERFKFSWARLFKNYDVIVCPTALDVAFPHIEAPWSDRTLLIDNREIPYGYNVFFGARGIHGIAGDSFPGRSQP